MTNIIQLSCKFPYYSFCVIRVYEQYTSSNAFRQCELKSQKMCSICDYVTLEFTRLRSRRGKNSSTRSRIIKPNYYKITLELTRLRSRRVKNSSTRSRIIKPNYYQITLELTRLRSRRVKNSSTKSRIIKPNYYQIMLSSRASTHPAETRHCLWRWSNIKTPLCLLGRKLVSYTHIVVTLCRIC